MRPRRSSGAPDRRTAGERRSWPQAAGAVALREPLVTASLLARRLDISARAGLDLIARLVDAGVLREMTGELPGGRSPSVEGPKEYADGFLDQLAAALSPFRPARFIALQHLSPSGREGRGAPSFAHPKPPPNARVGLKMASFRQRTVCGQLPGILGAQPVSRFRARNGPQGYPQIRWMIAGIASAPKTGLFPLEPVSRLP